MYDYVSRKIRHLKRIGLIAGSKTGLGMNGGAAPDWLVAEQNERRKAYEKARYRNFARTERAP